MNPTPLRLIVVDDESSVGDISQLQFRNAIKNGSLDFHFFENAKDCIVYLQTENFYHTLPTIILTDINMPDYDGYRLLQEVKSEHPEIDVFMMSAYSDEQTINKSLSMGADGYITKPVNYKNIKTEMEEKYGVVF
ncbi:MAG: response regulator [Bdellovibrio sp.]